MATAASMVFARQCSSRTLKRLSLCIALLSLIAFISNAYVYRFLKINYVQGIPQTGIIFEEWNPINRVTVTPQNYFGNKSLRINYDAAALAHMNFFD
jgi:hypothetical protein